MISGYRASYGAKNDEDNINVDGGGENKDDLHYDCDESQQ